MNDVLEDLSSMTLETLEQVARAMGIFNWKSRKDLEKKVRQWPWIKPDQPYR